MVRFSQVDVEHAWALHSTKNRGVETRSYRFHFSDGLVAFGLWGKAIRTSGDAATSIILSDLGKDSAASAASDRINRGEQVLVADLVLTGDAAPQPEQATRYPQLLATIGDRPLGIRASHLLALARWLKKNHGSSQVRIESKGQRSQVVALVGAALEPQFFSEIQVEEGMKSLADLLEEPVHYEQAPELFCLGLLPAFDIELLVNLAKPTRVRQRFQMSGSNN